MDRKLNIKLILSAGEDDPLRLRDPFMPVSLAILASVAPEHNYHFVDMLWEDHEFDSPADLVGISVRNSAEKTAFNLADEYRKRGLIVIMGGPQVSSNPFESLKHANAVAIGEGEKLWPVILEDFLKNDLRDFYVCSPEKFEANGYRIFRLESLPDLSGLPVAKRELYRRKYTFDMVFASRGCPINCDFCSVSGLFGKTYRLRPEEEVIDEIKSFSGYYYLIDDTVFGRPSTYNYYLSLYNKISKLNKVRYWVGQANLDAASDERGQQVIGKAVKAGLIYLAMGMESLNREVLKKSGSISKMGIKKDEDVIEKMKANIRFIQNQGILISGWFAIGYEDDNPETFKRTYEFCREMKIMPVFTPVKAFKGTDLYNRLYSEGRLSNDGINITNVPHPQMTNEQILHALEMVAKKGYGLKEIIRRTAFYCGKLIRCRNKPQDVIHKTIFALMTQIRMGQIVRGENNRMRNKIRV
jgi:radical SAM superfamily enzyme YgiQ (UPF0313 family)